MLLLILMILILSCAKVADTTSTQTSPSTMPENGQSESNLPISKPLPRPEIKLGKKLALWSTSYWIPFLKSVNIGGIELEDNKGKKLGIRLSEKDYCRAAMEGTAYVDGVTYNYAGSVSKIFSKKCTHGTGRSTFHKSKWPYGTGNKSNPLTPFRSIAADQSILPFGTVIFIPASKGNVYTFEGKEHIHDGIWVVEDTGGAIKGNHIDIFLGPEQPNPFKAWSKSRSDATFDAYIVLKE